MTLIRLVAPIVRRATTLTLIAAVTVPVSAKAQGDTRSTVVTFASASARANGCLHGQVRLSYKFRSCGDRPQLFYTLEAGSAQGYEGYWFKDREFKRPFPDRGMAEYRTRRSRRGHWSRQRPGERR